MMISSGFYWPQNLVTHNALWHHWIIRNKKSVTDLLTDTFHLLIIADDMYKELSWEAAPDQPIDVQLT